MSYVNTLISLLQVKFSRHYSSQIGCMSSLKTRLALVGVSQFSSPYSAQLSLPFVPIYTNFKAFPEQINEFNNFVRIVASVLLEHRYAGG